MNPKGQVYIAYHKPATLLRNDVVVPIQVGREIASTPFSGAGNGYTQQRITPYGINWLQKNMIGDNTGQHISQKNRQFDLLTLFYWLWKNKSDLPYVGVVSYRYLLNLNQNSKKVICPKDDFLTEIGLTSKRINQFMKDYDAIIPMKVKRNIADNYAEFHYKEDLELAFYILKEKYPAMSNMAHEVINTGIETSLSNFFILRQDLAQQYFDWLFSIIFEIEKQKGSEILLRHPYQQRAYGFIAERLFAIFMTYMEREKGLKILYVPIAVIQNPDIDAKIILWNQMQGKEY